MRYLYCTVIPLLLQILTVYITIEYYEGKVSWIGLDIFFFSLVILPATTIFNAIKTKLQTETKILLLFSQNLLISYSVLLIVFYIFIQPNFIT